MKKILFFLLIMVHIMHAVSKEKVTKMSADTKNPFNYTLGLKVIPSDNNDAAVMICSHGYGHNNEIADVIHSFGVTDNHLISFNFPDFNITDESDHSVATFGTIDEIIPLLYVIKTCITDLSLKSINLYGFSAGGGAVINALVVLNSSDYDERLRKIGITKEIKKQIIDALAEGLIILDCPLKSIEEIVAVRGQSLNFSILAKNYAQNNMRPIDTIQKLSDLQFNILLHFQQPDEILGNTDDELFITRLKQANKSVEVVISYEGGHNAYHYSLWQKYKQIVNNNKPKN